MLTNKFNILKDLDFESDNDNKSTVVNDQNKFTPIKQACIDDDLEYIKNCNIIIIYLIKL